MASYNNYFPQNYTTTPYSYGANINASPNQFSTINWVQGEAGARSVPVAAGQKVLLMDSERNVFYVKSSDVSGMPLPLRTFEYKEVEVNSNASAQTQTASTQTEYVTHEELKQALAQFKQKEEPKKKEKKEEKKNEIAF